MKAERPCSDCGKPTSVRYKLCPKCTETRRNEVREKYGRTNRMH